MWSEFWATAAAEFETLGGWCVIHGPEIWIGVSALCGALILAGAVGWYFWRWPK